MTNETKHTPDPWKAEHNDHYWTIVPESRSENDPYQIGDVCSSYPGEMNQGLQQANADHIVKCVNMHDELVGRMENILIAIGMGWDLEGVAEEVAETLKKAGAI